MKEPKLKKLGKYERRQKGDPANYGLISNIVIKRTGEDYRKPTGWLAMYYERLRKKQGHHRDEKRFRYKMTVELTYLALRDFKDVFHSPSLDWRMQKLQNYSKTQKVNLIHMEVTGSERIPEEEWNGLTEMKAPFGNERSYNERWSSLQGKRVPIK